MTMFTKIFAGAAGLAAVAAAPAAAQYGYYPPYGNAYGYHANNVTQFAVQQCTAAVQNRLSMSNRTGVTGILGGLLGAPVATGRVLSVTRVDPRENTVRVRGLANSGTSPYGVGAYGAVGYGYAPDLSFRCDVDYRGRIRDIDINRR